MTSGIFTFQTPNLGDDLQSLTAAHLVPHQSHFLNREAIFSRQVAEPTTVLMNYWFMSGRFLLPPHPSILPLYHGFSLGKDRMLSWGWRSHLKRHEPIGCRDTRTVELLHAAGIEAYWSGCITMFLGRWYKRQLPPRDGKVLLVDLPANAERFLPRHITERATRLSNDCPGHLRRDPIGRWNRIARITDELRTASLVVTKRLHAALPAAGFGVPVALLVEDKENDRRRFSGFEEFLPILFHREGKALGGIDWDNVRVPIFPAQIQDAFERLCKRLNVAPPIQERAQRNTVASKIWLEIPNPGIGASPGDVFAQFGRHRCRLPIWAWTDRTIVAELSAFHDVSAFLAPVVVVPADRRKEVVVGTIRDFAPTRTCNKPEQSQFAMPA